MKPEQREMLRHALLQGADLAKPRALALELARLTAVRFGFRPEDAELEAELAYLTEKGFLAREERAISPALAGWKITAAGRDYLEAQGL